MAGEGEDDAALVLPHMGHLMDEEPLVGNVLAAEIVAEQAAFRVKMDMAARCHCDAPGLEPPPFAVVERDRVIIDRVAENGLCEVAFGQGEAACRQCAWSPVSPAFMTFAGTSSFVPLAKVKVSVTVPAARAVGAMS